MAIGYSGLPELFPVDGVRLAAVPAGIKYSNRNDMVLIELAEGSTSAGMFTRNAFCAAPVVVAREHLQNAASRYWLINSGNANAGTGEQGMQAAQQSCESLAQQAGVSGAAVLPFSTGVIGEPLPVGKLIAAMPAALQSLSADNWEAAAKGIMTTDTVAKGASKRFQLGGKQVTLTGITKGAGMIRPDMATMLAYLATDAAVGEEALQTALATAVNVSFNHVTVDGDTSTNDAVMLAATGRAGNAPLNELGSDDYGVFVQALTELCQTLAQLIVRDGEGATKLITVKVGGGLNHVECEDVAYAIAHSPLVKTAFFAGDPNWGRILAALGRAGVPGLNLENVVIHLDEVCIVRDGGRAADYTEEAGQKVMKREEITIDVNLGRGEEEVTVWTCDLSYDYVKINAEYRS